LNIIETANHRPVRVDELNTALPQPLQLSEKGIMGIIARVYRNLSQIMAGMYTGAGCSSMPLEVNNYSDKKKIRTKKALL
jgi:hypothetical protein